MQKRIFKSVLSLIIAVVMCLCIAPVIRFGQADYALAEADYYSSVTATSGTELLGQLHDLMATTHTHYSNYGECGSSSNKTHVAKSDPGSDNSSLIEFYTQEDIALNKFDVSGGWNREHVWPKANSNGLWASKSSNWKNNDTIGGGGDLHHIRPAEKDLNNNRADNKYGEVSTKSNSTAQKASGLNAVGGWLQNGTFEPLDKVKGDVARILFYVYTHYNTYSNSIFGNYATLDFSSNSNGNKNLFGTLNFSMNVAGSESEAIALLLKWNKADPVDSIERTRNEYCATLQGNRNPFIDNESYADAIWGGGTATDPVTPPSTPTLSISKTTLSLTVGQTSALTATASDNSPVDWTTSNSSVVTVSNGTVTAVAAGTATITATAGSLIKTCTVTVTAGSTSTDPVTPPSENTGTVTITFDSFTDVEKAYAFQNWTAGGVSGIAFIYGGTAGKLQFNVNQKSYYIASTTATPGAITSVTVKGSDTDRDWQLLTSTSAYGQVVKYPTTGTDRGTKTVTATSGTTWTLDGNDTFFTLNYIASKGAGYIASITITYATGSTGGEQGGEEHTHTYGNPAWTWTGTTAAKATFTCTGGDNTKDVTATITSAVTTPATATTDGVKTYTATVTFGGSEYTDTKTETIPATGEEHTHTYGAPVWTWTGTTAAKATFTCTGGDDTKEETATITSAVTTPATATTDGEKTHTATVTFGGSEYTDTKTETIPATGEQGGEQHTHTYGNPVWTWTDTTAAKATFTCTDNDDTKDVTATITSAVTTPATATTDGVKTYTATVTFGGSEYTDTKTETIPATGEGHTHTYGNPLWSWKGTDSATATFYCSGCGNGEIVTATIEYTVNKQPTATEAGEITATATVIFSGVEYIASKTESIAATGEQHTHTYGEPSWQWVSLTEVKAIFVCTICHQAHTLEATVTSEQTRKPTSGSEGVMKYTAFITFNGVTYSNVHEESIPRKKGCSGNIQSDIAIVALCALLPAVYVLTKKSRRAK